MTTHTETEIKLANKLEEWAGELMGVCRIPYTSSKRGPAWERGAIATTVFLIQAERVRACGWGRASNPWMRPK